MVSFLQKAKDLTPKDSVKLLLHQHLTTLDPARPLSTIHASSLTRPEGYCPREAALHKAQGKKPPDQWLTTSERMTFQIGRDQERNVVLWLSDMGRAFCHWRCVACGEKMLFCRRPSKCSSCTSNTFEPEEIRFTSSETGASCGIDVSVSLEGPKLRAVELKTMDKDQFKELKAPLAEHRLRLNLYLRIIAESDQHWANMFDTSSASIFYISKGGYGCSDPQVQEWGLMDNFSPFKEFTVQRDDGQTNDISTRAKAFRDYMKEGGGMPQGVCTTAMDKRAKACPCKGPCFSGSFPATNLWKDGHDHQ